MAKAMKLLAWVSPLNDTGGGRAREIADHYYRQYGPAVYRRCLALLTEPTAARNATRDVFLTLLLQTARIEEPREILAWVYEAATQHCERALLSQTEDPP